MRCRDNRLRCSARQRWPYGNILPVQKVGTCLDLYPSICARNRHYEALSILGPTYIWSVHVVHYGIAAQEGMEMDGVRRQRVSRPSAVGGLVGEKISEGILVGYLIVTLGERQ